MGDHQFEELPDHRQPWLLCGRIALCLLSGLALGDSRRYSSFRASRVGGLPSRQCVLHHRAVPVPPDRLPNPRRDDSVECAATHGGVSGLDVLFRAVHRIALPDGPYDSVARADPGTLGVGGRRRFPAAANPASRALYCARVRG